jgi:hypothetical protein
MPERSAAMPVRDGITRAFPRRKITRTGVKAGSGVRP